MADDDESTNVSDIDKERRKREQPTDLEKELAVIAKLRSGEFVPPADAAAASDYVMGIDVGEKAAEQRFQIAMLNVDLDFSLRTKIQAEYAALKNKRA